MNTFDIFKFKRYSTLNWTHVLFHHSQTKDGNSYDTYAIDRYHVEYNGWDELGYHFIIEEHNGYYRVCFGRSLSTPGAHCPGMNRKAIGICLVGNYDIIAPNDKQYFLSACVSRMMMDEFHIPIENIQGHNMYSYKTCPGKLFDFNKLKWYIKGKPAGGI